MIGQVAWKGRMVVVKGYLMVGDILPAFIMERILKYP